MFTEGLITTPLPTFAPKSRSNRTLMPLIGFSGFIKNKTFTKYHISCFIFPAPITKFPVE
jgi:hypothetical protein